MNPAGPTVCPVCHESDRIQKVSAVVESGTPLAQKLSSDRIPMPTSPGPKPIRTSDSDIHRSTETDVKFSEYPFGTKVLITLATLLMLAAIIVGLGVGTQISWLAGVVIAVVGEAVAFGLFALMRPHVVGLKEAKYQRLLQTYNDKERRYSTALDQRTRAVSTWNRLYYCHRDDVVFLPDRSDSASASQMTAYISR